MTTICSSTPIINEHGVASHDAKMPQISATVIEKSQSEPHHSNGTALKAVWKPPPSTWTAQSHSRAEELTREVDGYFLKHWKFANPKAEQAFVNAGFSKVTCLYFPMARDDRIRCACILLTVLFLIDDLLDDMSLAEGKAFNAKLVPIMRGQVQPDRTVAVEYIHYDLWAEMRSFDRALADAVLEDTLIFMQAQTDKVRLTIKDLGPYFEYREKDVGKALLSALMRFTMNLHLSLEELKSLEALEGYCARHISIINDIFSWEKELKASQTSSSEGAVLCSAVKVLADETSLRPEAAKRILWCITREWEQTFDTLAKEMLTASNGCTQAVKDYIKGLEYQMSGNERWSTSTLRYTNP